MLKHIARTAVLAALLTATVAQAGQWSWVEVYVNKAARYAGGSLGATRASKDITQYIGCTVTSGSGYCGARTSSGDTFYCFTSSPPLVEVMRSLSGDSGLLFAWDADGKCTFVQVANFSYYEPKR